MRIHQLVNGIITRIWNNKEWLFSGAGITFIALIGKLLLSAFKKWKDKHNNKPINTSTLTQIPRTFDYQIYGENPPPTYTVLQGKSFCKCWTLLNLSSFTWIGCTLICRYTTSSLTVKEEIISIRNTPPGNTVDIVCELYANTPGICYQEWQMYDADRNPLFESDRVLSQKIIILETSDLNKNGK